MTSDLKGHKNLKGQLQGYTAISKGLKITFRTKILKKKNYTRLISVKNTTNFVLTTFLYDFFLTALLIVVKLKFSDAPRAQDNLSKLLSA